MGGVKGPAPLASFADNWVGGDIHGLSALAGTLYGYVPEITDVAGALDSQVRRIVGDAGWQGSAASTFTSAWSKDSQTARAVGIAADQLGGTVDWLAVELSRIESALEGYAAEARSHGVTIGANGEPPQVCYGPASNARQAEQQKWTTWYQKTWQNCMNAAKAARQEAAAALGQFCEQIVGKEGMSAADAATVGDLLGDLLAVPSAYSRNIARDLGGIRKTAKALISEGKALLKDHELFPRSLLDEMDTSRSQLAAGDAALRVAQSNENMITKALNVRAGNVIDKLAGLMGRGGDGPGGADVPGGAADTAGDAADAGRLSKLVDFGEDIPVLDVLAGAVGTGLGTWSDVQGGQPVYEALPEEAVSNFGGVAAGAAASAGVVALVGGGAGVAVGAVVGGVVAYGVGDFTHNLFEENWGADIHHDGVVGGVAHGITDSAVKTGKDFVNMGTDVAHTAEHVWDSIF